jgi:hypothetical protein
MHRSIRYGIPTSDQDNASVGVVCVAVHQMAISTSSVLAVDEFCKLSEEVQYHLARIERTGAFKLNWDHQGGLPPDPRVVVLAKRYVKEFGCRGLTPNHVGAGPNGEIYVEYRDSHAREAQVQFCADGNHELLLIDGDEYPYEGVFQPTRLVRHMHER